MAYRSENPNYRPPVASGPTIEFPMPGGNSIEIRLKKPVSKKDFERIKQLVDLSEDSLVQADDELIAFGRLFHARSFERDCGRGGWHRAH